MADFYLSILYNALSRPIGLLLASPNPGLDRQRLYQARVKSLDPSLAELQIRTSPFPDGDLVVCHQRVTLKDQKAATT